MRPEVDGLFEKSGLPSGISKSVSPRPAIRSINGNAEAFSYEKYASNNISVLSQVRLADVNEDDEFKIDS
jgi:hypothetical protein|tara:strand:- start:213 stop:422 length:210 start_codon:yes stop_codon:yes gene_type:complete